MMATYALIALCTLVFLGQLILGPEFSSLLALMPAYLSEAPWTLLTSMFAHGDMGHLFFNMFALFVFGTALERKIGSGNFLLLYLLSGIVGGIGFMLLDSPFGSAVGASGAIYGVIGAVALLMPNMVVYLMGIPMPMYIAGFVYLGIELFGLGAADGIAHSAHILGLFGGVGAGFWFRNAWGDFGVAKAAVAGVAAALLVGLAFGAYYDGDGAVAGVKLCESQLEEIGRLEDASQLEGIIACERTLAASYEPGSAKRGMVCGEYARWAGITCESENCYNAVYDECVW